MATKFYWYSVRMVTIDGESYSDSVSRGKHPFQIQRDEQDSLKAKEP
jgi:hypothetical protein